MVMNNPSKTWQDSDVDVVKQLVEEINNNNITMNDSVRKNLIRHFSNIDGYNKLTLSSSQHTLLQVIKSNKNHKKHLKALLECLSIRKLKRIDANKVESIVIKKIYVIGAKYQTKHFNYKTGLAEDANIIVVRMGTVKVERLQDGKYYGTINLDKQYSQFVSSTIDDTKALNKDNEKATLLFL